MIWTKAKSPYHSVGTNEVEACVEHQIPESQKQHSPGKRGDKANAHTTRNLLYVFMALCAIVLIAGIGYTLLQPDSSKPGNPAGNQAQQSALSPCGNSSSEARSLGCSFDQLMWAWYPPSCPHYANEKFIAAEPGKPWRYYDNLYHGKPVFAEDENWVEILDSGVQLWGERREHLTHCVYMFLSAGEIIWGGGKYVPKLVSSEHFEHCVAILLDALRQDSTWFNIETSVPRPSFESC